MRIIKIDGHCNLCNGFVRIVYNSNKTKFHYSVFREDEEKTAVEYIVDDNIYIGAEAIIKILSDTDSLRLLLLARLMSVFPSRLVMCIYVFIAKRRYILFGRKEACSITDQIPHKFRI